MNKVVPIALSTLLLAGCDGSLVFRHPEFVPSNRYSPLSSLACEVTPKQPKLGDTLTVRVSGLSAEMAAHAYLSPADLMGGDPEGFLPRPGGTPVFRLGRLNPVDGEATLSFELRATMGNDQFGNPFTLASSQSWTILILEKDKYGRSSGVSGGNADFTIL